MCGTAYLHGEIKSGDAKKVTEFYRQHHKVLRYVYLVSPGGNVRDGIEIGRLFRKYLIHVEAPVGQGSFGFGALIRPTGDTIDDLCEAQHKKCVCASTCALVWFGGVEREGEIGLHRPRIEEAGFAALSPDKAAKEYQRVLDTVVQYLSEMEVPRRFVEEIIETGSSDIRWVSDSSLDHPPSFAEWRDANCGGESKQENDAWVQILTLERPLTAAEEDLKRRAANRSKCQIDIVFHQLDRMTAP
jgi:hypothetical protein